MGLAPLARGAADVTFGASKVKSKRQPRTPAPSRPNSQIADITDSQSARLKSAKRTSFRHKQSSAGRKSVHLRKGSRHMEHTSSLQCAGAQADGADEGAFIRIDVTMPEPPSVAARQFFTPPARRAAGSAVAQPPHDELRSTEESNALASSTNSLGIDARHRAWTGDRSAPGPRRSP